MIKDLRIRDFTCFAEADLKLGALNVFVGENGTGKTHLLKLLYLFGRLGRETHGAHSVGSTPEAVQAKPWRQVWREKAVERLDGLFVPDDLENLVRGAEGVRRAKVRAETAEGDAQGFMLDDEGYLDADLPDSAYPTGDSWLSTYATFLSARDVLLVDPRIRTVFKRYDLREEQSTWDILDEIIAPARKDLDPTFEQVFQSLAAAIGAKPDVDGKGRVFFARDAGQQVSAALSAQGHVKLAALALLLTRSEIAPGWILCWDEPEANLNPALIKVAARAIVDLAKAGVQVCIATHSLFLLREIEILQSQSTKPVAARYFGLHLGANGTVVEQGDTADDMGDIRSLDEELAQSERYMAKEFADANA